jgi:RNA polymerase sigma factor (sigma-70 family)
MTMAPEGEFEKLTMPFRTDLLRYCRKLAGTEWDGEDLFQEVMLKAFCRHQRWPERELTKPYLYRMAANAWFDTCRRQRIAFYPELLEEQLSIPYEEWSRFDIRESLELLMDRLEPRQVVLILLTDVFGFSPTEAGQALGQPITAIKAALHRARSRLKKAADRQLHRFEEKESVARPSDTDTDLKAHAALFESFVTAFREADAHALFQTYRALTVNRLVVEHVALLRGQAWFYFKDPDGNLLMLTAPYTRQSV